jgi:hypothetical protein
VSPAVEFREFRDFREFIFQIFFPRNSYTDNKLNILNFVFIIFMFTMFITNDSATFTIRRIYIWSPINMSPISITIKVVVILVFTRGKKSLSH